MVMLAEVEGSYFETPPCSFVNFLKARDAVENQLSLCDYFKSYISINSPLIFSPAH